MSALIPDSEIQYLKQLYPEYNIRPLTAQQERLVLYHIRGMEVSAAARAAGYSSYAAAKDVLELEHVQATMHYLRQKHFRDSAITRETLTGMLLDAHSHAATATEEVIAVREIGKMHGLYESDKQRAAKLSINVDQRVQNIKQVERLDDQKLIELAGDEITLDPADYKRIGDDGDD